MDRRRALLALACSVAPVAPLGSIAQQSSVRRIGFLSPTSRTPSSAPASLYDAFVKGMQSLGYIEGRNLAIEWRYAQDSVERLRQFASELSGLPVEVIVTHGGSATQALQRATKTIPVVTAVVIDPVGSGFAASLAHPGGNITGLSNIAVDLSAKQLELLRMVMPKLQRVAVLQNPDNPSHPEFVASVTAAGQKINLKIAPVQARKPADVEDAFATARRERAGAMVVAGDAFLLGQGPRLAALSMKSTIPTIAPWREHVVAGCFMSYGQDLGQYFRRAATYVDKIFNGAKPADLPFEQPTNIHLAINMAAGKTLGLAVPKHLVVLADEVIE